MLLAAYTHTYLHSINDPPLLKLLLIVLFDLAVLAYYEIFSIITSNTSLKVFLFNKAQASNPAHSATICHLLQTTPNLIPSYIQLLLHLPIHRQADTATTSSHSIPLSIFGPVMCVFSYLMRELV